MAREIFVDKDYPYMGDLEYKTVIALVNTHPAIDFPEPLPPNIIPVGGLQIKEGKPLAKVKIMQEAKGNPLKKSFHLIWLQYNKPSCELLSNGKTPELAI